MSAPFFIGWSGRADPALGRFLAAAALGWVAGLGLLGLALGAGLDDPSAGLIGLAPAPQVAPFAPEARTVQGVLEPGPYPILRLPPTADRPQGEALLLNGFGKTGTPVAASDYGALVEAQGTVFRRGDIAMLTTDGAFTLVDGPAAQPAAAERLGRWRIAGEVCDGKCYAGIMRPGSGLGHGACAALCFVGEVPLVFVAAAPVAGSAFFVLADADGGPPPDAARAVIGVPVALEVALERRGSIMIFRVDFDRARLL